MAINVIEFTLRTKDLASSGIKRFVGGVVSLGKTMAKFAVIALAAATATIAFTRSIANAQDEAGKYALKIGKAVENITAYQFAAKMAGVETRTFNMAVQRMERRLGEAALGGGEALSTLRDLGIEAKIFADLPLDVQLETLSDKFTKMTSGTMQLKTAFKLFDSEGVVMLQLLKKGSPAMREMADQARILGLVVSQEAAANSEAFNDSLTRLFGSITGTSRAVGNELIPMMTGLADALTAFVVQNRDKVANFFTSMTLGFLTVGIMAKIAFDDVKAQIAKTFSVDGFNDFVDGFKQSIIFIASSAPKFILSFGKILLTGFKVIWESFASAGKWAWNSIKSIFGGKDTVSLGEFLFKNLVEATAKARDDFSLALDDFKVIAKKDGKKIGDAIGGAIESSMLIAGAQAKELMKTFSVFGDLSAKSKSDEVEQTDTFLQLLRDKYKAYIEGQKSTADQLATSMSLIFTSATASIGDAVAQSIVQVENLAELMKSVLSSVAQSIISMLVQIGIQRLAASIIAGNATKAQSATDISAAAGRTYANAFAATIGIPGVGIFAANAVASASAANMLAGAAASGALGAATGVGLVAHGGIDYVPREQTALVQKGERIISPNQNRDLTGFLNDSGGGGGGGVVIESIIILPNATNAQALLDMPPEDMRRIVEEKIIDALDELDGVGVRQKRLEGLV